MAVLQGNLAFMLPQRGYGNPLDVINIACCLRNRCRVVRHGCNLCIAFHCVSLMHCAEPPVLVCCSSKIHSHLNNGIMVFYTTIVIMGNDISSCKGRWNLQRLGER